MQADRSLRWVLTNLVGNAVSQYILFIFDLFFSIPDVCSQLSANFVI